MSANTGPLATRADAVPELHALVDRAGPHARAALVALDRWVAAAYTAGEKAATDRILDIVALSTDLDHVITDDQAAAIVAVIRQETGHVE